MNLEQLLAVLEAERNRLIDEVAQLDAMERASMLFGLVGLGVSSLAQFETRRDALLATISALENFAARVMSGAVPADRAVATAERILGAVLELSGTESLQDDVVDLATRIKDELADTAKAGLGGLGLAFAAVLVLLVASR